MAKRPGEPVLELERASFVGSRGDAAILKEAGLPPSGLRVLRYSAAKLRRSAGESIEDMSRFLDHSARAVTSTYLRRLERQEDKSWGKVAEAIGLG